MILRISHHSYIGIFCLRYLRNMRSSVCIFFPTGLQLGYHIRILSPQHTTLVCLLCILCKYSVFCLHLLIFRNSLTRICLNTNPRSRTSGRSDKRRRRSTRRHPESNIQMDISILDKHKGLRSDCRWSISRIRQRLCSDILNSIFSRTSVFLHQIQTNSVCKPAGRRIWSTGIHSRSHIMARSDTGFWYTTGICPLCNWSEA